MTRYFRWRKISRADTKQKISVLILLALNLYLLTDLLGIFNKIAVVVIEGTIQSQPIIRVLDVLEKDFFVRAIVLRINSPGGGATDVHEVYYKLLKVKSKKPVVVSIDSLGASGAYYIASATDYIIAKQSSEIGGVGVIAEIPEEVEKPNIITSGPFKVIADEKRILRNIEQLKLDFIEVIKFGRGEKLKIDPFELTTARLYSGFDAKDIGLIDEIGGLEDAILKASELANVRNFKIVYVYPTIRIFSPLYVSESHISSNTTSSPVYYYLYVKLRSIE